MEELELETPEFEEQPKQKRKPGRKPGVKIARAVSAPQVVNQGMTPEQVAAMLETVISKMKEPTILEQRKLDEDEAQRKKVQQMRVDGARRVMENTLREQKHCSHKQPNGKHKFRAQVGTDGMIRGCCTYCHAEFGPIKATQDQLTTGANFHNYPDLTLEALKSWEARAAV